MTENKLWSTNRKLSSDVESFTIGNDQTLDLLLAPWDIIGSMAHAAMLFKSGLLSLDETNSLLNELYNLYSKAIENELQIESGVEDIHSQIELELIRSLGDTGKKIHAGRSRNDQVLLDIRLYIRSEIALIANEVKLLGTLLLEKAEEYKDDLIPGYTHMQIAMVSSYGLWFGSFAESLTDDLEILHGALKLNNRNPLGTAAGYGTNLPISRELTTSLLFFDDPIYISAYAQNSRPKSDMAMANAVAALASTLSKLASDIILFSGQNFGLFSPGDNISTGSSIMPQKRNPDVLELIRGRCNQLASLPGQILLLTGNLNSGYHRDFQLLKELLLPSIESIKELFTFTKLALNNLTISKNSLENKLYQPLLSTYRVNDLVKSGKPFRDAYHEVAGQIGKLSFTIPEISDFTHLGSIGNPGFEHIRKRMAKSTDRFTFPEAKTIIDSILASIENSEE
jgi:argininosuccinate lyase